MPFGRGTLPQLGDLRSPWLLTTYEVHCFISGLCSLVWHMVSLFWPRINETTFNLKQGTSCWLCWDAKTVQFLCTVIEKYMAQSLHMGLHWPFTNLPFGICAIHFDLKVQYFGTGGLLVASFRCKMAENAAFLWLLHSLKKARKTDTQIAVNSTSFGSRKTFKFIGFSIMNWFQFKFDICLDLQKIQGIGPGQGGGVPGSSWEFPWGSPSIDMVVSVHVLSVYLLSITSE